MNFDRTLAALQGYDVDKKTVGVALDRARDDRDVEIALAAERDFIATVQIAFYRDTQDRNNLETVLFLPVETILNHAENIGNQHPLVHKLFSTNTKRCILGNMRPQQISSGDMRNAQRTTK